ncbi:MAG TPA: hypothetical protein VFO65_01595 [Acidimicrobiales bacterium]|nr:hypothetical protein [Acidimicrobiales bacterium]
MAKHPMGDVIVLLPGILGSVLERDGEEVWAPTPGAAWRALRSLGRNVKALRLTDDPVDEDVLDDGVTATRLVPDVHLVPGLWGIDGYSGIRRMILDSFDVVPGVTYLEHAYDWRRDNRVAARLLKARLDPALAEARKANPDAKAVLVGHSMGGLVARWYLEKLDGWRDTRRLVTFGTPYRGSLNALDFIANGFVKKVGPFTVADLSELLLSLTSVYQLLPVYPCLDLGGPELVRVAESEGVPHLDTKRAVAALTDFHRAIEAAVAQRPEHAYEIHPVVGLTQPTLQSAALAGGAVKLLRSRLGNDESGDGTVPRVSATPIELGDNPSAVYASQKHASLQNADSVQTQLLGVLSQIAGLGSIRETRLGLSVELDPVFEAGEPVGLTVGATVPNLTLAATVTDLGTGVSDGPHPLREDGDTGFSLELAPRPPGDYRVTVQGTDVSAQVVQPVTDVFMVVPSDPDAD